MVGEVVCIVALNSCLGDSDEALLRPEVNVERS